MSLTAPSWHWRSLLLYGPHLRATTQDATPNCQSALPRDVRIRLAILGVSDQQAIKLAMQAEDASRDRTRFLVVNDSQRGEYAPLPRR